MYMLVVQSGIPGREGGSIVKITIAYIPDEEEAATTSVAALRRISPGMKVRESERHPPFKHIYLTTKKPETPCRDK